MFYKPNGRLAVQARFTEGELTELDRIRHALGIRTRSDLIRYAIDHLIRWHADREKRRAGRSAVPNLLGPTDPEPGPGPGP